MIMWTGLGRVRLLESDRECSRTPAWVSEHGTVGGSREVGHVGSNQSSITSGWKL